MKRETQRDIITRLAEEQRLSHAYLLSGNDEAEKEAVLREVIRALLVQTADLAEISPEETKVGGEITIGQIRALRSFFSLSSWSSPFKAGVIRQAHCMNREAQSAFLNVLEEPKGSAVFFLLSEYPDMLLETIRSRTQEFKFYSFARAESSAASVRELQTLQRAGIAERFGLAKELAETPERLGGVLQEWLLAARQLLRSAAREQARGDMENLAASIALILEVSLLLRTTNINPRLALERILLDL